MSAFGLPPVAPAPPPSARRSPFSLHPSAFSLSPRPPFPAICHQPSAVGYCLFAIPAPPPSPFALRPSTLDPCTSAPWTEAPPFPPFPPVKPAARDPKSDSSAPSAPSAAAASRPLNRSNDIAHISHIHPIPVSIAFRRPPRSRPAVTHWATAAEWEPPLPFGVHRAPDVNRCDDESRMWTGLHCLSAFTAFPTQKMFFLNKKRSH